MTAVVAAPGFLLRADGAQTRELESKPVGCLAFARVAHDVFISYSKEDKPTAEAMGAILQSQGIRCWIAPRDILPGSDWAASIINAIETAPIMVLVFSKHANDSRPVRRELNRAIASGVTVIPVRVEDVTPLESLKHSISVNRWIDAFPLPLDTHRRKLADFIQDHLHTLAKSGAGAVKPPEPAPPPGG